MTTAVNLRRCRFVQWQPRAVNICAAGKDCLAVAREKGGIELWSRLPGLKRTARLVGGPKSVEGLAWARSRLFSVSLDGSVTEWDLERCIPRRQVDTNGGGAAWSCCVSPDQKILAVGCENGSVRLFDLGSEKEGLKWTRNIDLHQKGRILSVTWSACGKHLATGSAAGHINIIDMAQSRPVHSMRADPTVVRDAKNQKEHKDSLVWSLAFSSSSELWSVDSSGRLSAWSTLTGTLNEAFRLSEGDLLSLACHPSKAIVYAAGVDQKVYELRRNQAEQTWFVAGHSRVHKHDIRSLALLDEATLLSGGVDTLLVTYPVEHVSKGTRKIYPASEQVIKTCGQLVWANEGESIRAWECTADLKEPPKQLLHLQFPSDHVSAFEVSADWIVCLLASGTMKAYSFEFVKDEQGTVTDVTLDESKLGLNLVQAIKLVGSTLHCAIGVLKSDSVIIAVDLGNPESERSSTQTPFTHIDALAHANGGFVAFSRNQLVSFHGEKKPTVHKLECSYKTIVPVDEDRLLLVADQAVDLFSLKEGKLVEFPKHIKSQLASCLKTCSSIANASFHSGKVFLYGHKQVISIDLSMAEALPAVSTPRLRRSTRRAGKPTDMDNAMDIDEASSKNSQASVKMSDQFRDLLYAGRLDDGSLLFVERPWEDVISALPPAFKRDIFGGYN